MHGVHGRMESQGAEGVGSHRSCNQEDGEIGISVASPQFVVVGARSGGRQQSERSRGQLAAAGSILAGVALISCVWSFSSSAGRSRARGVDLSLDEALESFERSQSSQKLALLPQHLTTNFDVAVPKGVAAGQSFLVSVPGHRERKVQVPRGFKPGEDLSIKVGSSFKQQLQEEGEAAAEAADAEAAAEPEADAVPPAGGEVVGFGGDTAGGLPSIGFDQTSSQTAKTDGGMAVDSVHSYFVKEHKIGQRWAPGDTQRIPALQPLGTQTTGQWTSAAEIYGNQRATQMQIANSREEGQWIPGHPRGPTFTAKKWEPSAPVHWNHFKLVDKGYEQHEMAKPSWYARKSSGPRSTQPGTVGTLPLNPYDGTQDAMHTAAYANPNFSGENPGLVQEGDGMEMVSPQIEPPASEGAEGAKGAGGATPQKVPGFVVATPDDAGPGGHKVEPPRAETVAPAPRKTNIVLQFPQTRAPQSRFVTIPNVGGSITVPQPIVPVTVPQSVSITITHHGPGLRKVTPAVVPEYLPELQKIPKIQPLKFFDREDERAGAGVFKHWDGRAMKVLNVVSESPGEAIDLNPGGWNGQPGQLGPGGNGTTSEMQEPQGPPGFAGPLVQSREGLHAAGRVSGYGKGDRNGLRYRQFGDLAPAVGEPRGSNMPDPVEPTVIPSDPFGIRKTATPSVATEPLEVKVPQGVSPGQQFDAAVPGGREVAVTVPEDAKVGQELEIKVPKKDVK